MQKKHTPLTARLHSPQVKVVRQDTLLEKKVRYLNHDDKKTWQETWYGAIGFHIGCLNELELHKIMDELCEFLKKKGKERSLTIQDWDVRKVSENEPEERN